MGSINQLEQQLKKDKEALNRLNKTISDCDVMLQILNHQLPYLGKHPWVSITVYDEDKSDHDGYPIHRSITITDLTADEIEFFKAIVLGKKAAAETRKQEIEAKYP